VNVRKGHNRGGRRWIPLGGIVHVGAFCVRRGRTRMGGKTLSGGGREHVFHRTMRWGSVSTDLRESVLIPFRDWHRGLASGVVGTPKTPIDLGSSRRSDRENGASKIVPRPSAGRVFTANRQVRLGDVDAGGRLRLDSVARYLQDVATDDSKDVGQLEARTWVVRRTLIEQHRSIRADETVSLATFCAGMGNRWAERRVSLATEGGGAIEAATLWVYLDPSSGRPAMLPESFRSLYQEPSGGREVTARQEHMPLATDDPDVHSMPWWPRFADLDVLDHVNNAIAWSVVEQTLQRACSRELIDIDVTGPMRIEVEFRDAIDRDAVLGGMPLTIVYRATDTALDIALWSTDDKTAYVTAKVMVLR